MNEDDYIRLAPLAKLDEPIVWIVAEAISDRLEAQMSAFFGVARKKWSDVAEDRRRERVELALVAIDAYRRSEPT